jgi:hypothetical protein
MKKKNNTQTKTIVALSAGAVAIATSAYYFFGPSGKIHQKKAVGWMIKMKGEVIEQIENAKEMSEPIYHSIVDSVLATYVAGGKIAKPELDLFAKSLKGQWKSIVKTLPKKKTKSK